MTIKGKDLIERVSDKEYSEELLKELEKYEVKGPKSVWELKEEDEVWLVYYDFKKDTFSGPKTKWFGLIQDNYNRELGKIHLTKERAELHARVLNTELAIKKWKRENDNVELDWNDIDEYKYTLVYDYKFEEVIVCEWSRSKHANTIYFSSESAALQCVNDIGKDRITEWIKWEDNDRS